MKKETDGIKEKTAEEISERLKKIGDAPKARLLQGFFKTGAGQYGEGDLFLGIQVPMIRKLTKEYCPLPFPELLKLLHSSFHEARLLALLIMVRAYQKGDDLIREKIYRLYLKNTRHINNWDLVDLSADPIVGAHLWNRNRDILRTLASSKLLWDRRIAIMATFHFIKKGEYSETLQIARLLLRDPEDLIHKAVGWMLREIGKRDPKTEESFLKKHYRIMPRTMLRYAIERFPESLRQGYLKGEK
ncbi:MAG: DNA alkylation repair protein [Thermodesulfobacteriota bacterium]